MHNSSPAFASIGLLVQPRSVYANRATYAPRLLRCIRSGLWLPLCLVLALLAAGNVQGNDFFFDGFETSQSLDAWGFDGPWEIGVPTSGPGAAHEGTNCAATLLAGNYPDDTRGRLVSPVFVVPGATHSPRLRFWHWYSFNCSDWGQVQIKVGSSDWVPLTADNSTYTAYSSGVWSQPGFDLSAFAGKSVQVGFYFESHNNGSGGCGFGSVDVSAGWYIDEVRVVTGPIVFANPENYELGFGDWSVDGGTWEIGMPSVGPATAHEGAHCAGTVLSGNYSDDTMGRLVSPAFVVPDSMQNPRLRFSHWYSFSCSDFGQIQIKVETNAWTELSPRYYASSSGAWSQPGFDLSAHAGKKVQIGFYFESHNDGSGGCGFGSVDVSAGWYIDEVRVVTGPIVFANPENFELGTGDWSVDGGTWEVGVPSGGPATAHQGTNCVGTALRGNYADDTRGRLVSPAFLVPPAFNLRLRFWQWYSFSCSDFGQVQIKAGAGDWVTLPEGTFTATSGGWNRPSFDLSAYAGQLVQIGFYFESHNDGSGGCGFGSPDVSAGWYIDEVRLLHDFSCQLIGSPIVRTQTAACVSLGIAADNLPSTVNFTLQATAGQIGHLGLNTEGCWSGALTPLSASQWRVALTNHCSTTPLGVATAGTICFTAISEQSAFVALTIVDLDDPPPPRHGLGTRAVLIAHLPLLEAWLDSDDQRMATLYGIAGKTYAVDHSFGGTNPPWTWAPGWTNTVSTTLSHSFGMIDSLTNAPRVFLRAREH